MGCCGREMAAEKIIPAVEENTREFSEGKLVTEQDFLQFRDRKPAWDLREGVCRNLIQEKGCFVCPLYPTRHQGKDLRRGHCDADFMCGTAKEFNRWDPLRKGEFLTFIELKRWSNVEYSLKMIKGEGMKEFKEGDV